MHPTKITFKNLTAASLAWQLMLKECNVRKSAAHSRAAIARCKSILDHYLLQICLSNAVARPQLQKPSALILRFSNPSHLVWCIAQCFTTMLQTFARHDQRRCWGRWNLMAQKIYRCDSLCVYVGSRARFSSYFPCSPVIKPGPVIKRDAHGNWLEVAKITYREPTDGRPEARMPGKEERCIMMWCYVSIVFSDPFSPSRDVYLSDNVIWTWILYSTTAYDYCIGCRFRLYNVIIYVFMIRHSVTLLPQPTVWAF